MTAVGGTLKTESTVALSNEVPEDFSQYICQLRAASPEYL